MGGQAAILAKDGTPAPYEILPTWLEGAIVLALLVAATFYA
jgi:hypothetical protein